MTRGGSVAIDYLEDLSTRSTTPREQPYRDEGDITIEYLKLFGSFENATLNNLSARRETWLSTM